MFSLHFLAASDNRPKVDSTSYCSRFPVFDFRSSHGFLQPARNILLYSGLSKTHDKIEFFAKPVQIDVKSEKVNNVKSYLV